MERGSSRPGIKLWLERDESLLFSGYRAELLRQVQLTGSLARAAVAMGLSYRRAWGKLREIEENLGVQLVQSDVGGAGGGRSRLTDDGEQLLAAWLAFSSELCRAAEELFQKHFLDVGALSPLALPSRQAAQQIEVVADDARRTAIDER